MLPIRFINNIRSDNIAEFSRIVDIRLRIGHSDERIVIRYTQIVDVLFNAFLDRRKKALCHRGISDPSVSNQSVYYQKLQRICNIITKIPFLSELITKCF